MFVEKYRKKVNPFEVVITISSITLVISGFLSYVLSFYLGFSTDKALLYNALDPGYVAPGYLAKPILGVHYWGDLQSALSFAAHQNPYSLELEYPSPYPPFGILIFKPFVFFDPVVALIVMTSVTFLLVSYTFIKFVDSRKNFQYWQVLILTLLVSKPLLLALDRGNLQGIVVSLMILTVIHLRNNQIKLAKFCIVIAIALKGYPVLMLLVFVRRKRYKEILETIWYSALVTIASAILLSGSKILEIPIGLLKGVSVQSGSNKSGLSAASSVVRLFDATQIWNPQQGRNIAFLLLALACGTALTTLLTFYVFNVKVWSKVDDMFVVMLSTFVVPVSWTYNAIWLPFFIVALSEEILTLNRSKHRENLFRLELLAILVAINVPFPFLWRGQERIGVGLLELLLFPICASIFYTRLKGQNIRIFDYRTNFENS